LFAEANAANMDIFDEVDMESSHIDDQLLAYTLPLKPQDATAAGSRQPKAIRRKVDEGPLGAESGETRTSWQNITRCPCMSQFPQVQRLRMPPQRHLFLESAKPLPQQRNQS
jgi:hypothetical protein